MISAISNSVDAGTETSDSDIDLLVVGDVALADVAMVIRPAEKRLGRPINPVVLSGKEARRKLKEKDHFLNTVRRGKKIFVIGEEHELAEAFS